MSVDCGLTHYAKSELQKSNQKLRKDTAIATAFVAEVNARLLEKMETIKSQELTIGSLRMDLDMCEKKNVDMLQQTRATSAPSVEDGLRREMIDGPNKVQHVDLASMAPQ